MADESKVQSNPVDILHDYKFKRGDVIAKRYQVIEAICYGGFSEVYHCTDTHLMREVAVKVLIKGEGSLREARIAARLYHQNIAEVYDVDTQSDGKPIVVLEYINGITLEKRLSDAPHRRLPLDSSTLKIIREIAEALDYAHSRKVFHRDVKPSNVIIDFNGEVHLTDFGLAEISLPEDQYVSVMTADISERLSGTIAYMSPEQFRDGVSGSEKSDQYSLAIMAYEMLTGRYPYPGREARLIIQIATTPPQPPTSINPDLPKGVDPVLLRALSKTPNERFGSCREFAEKLVAVAEAYVLVQPKYHVAIQSVDIGDWRNALTMLEELNSNAPGFEDTEKYLEIARRQVQLLDLYERASQLVEQGAFREASTTLDFLTQLDSTYDIAILKSRIEEGQARLEQERLHDLYQQAVRQFQQGEFEASVDTLETICQRDPQFPDTDNIESRARNQATRQRELRELLALGKDQADHQQWAEAIATFSLLLEKDPTYPGIDLYLTQTQLWASIAANFSEAEDLHRKGKYAASVDKARSIQSTSKAYRSEDVTALIDKGLNCLHSQFVSQLNAGLYEDCLITLGELEMRTVKFDDLESLGRQARQGRQKQLLKAELDADYGQALEYIRHYDYKKAIAVWQSIQNRRHDLSYSDAQDVEGQALRGLATDFYIKAVVALTERKLKQALNYWQQVKKIEPSYPDRQHIAQRARKLQDKIPDDQNQGKVNKSNLRNAADRSIEAKSAGKTTSGLPSTNSDRTLLRKLLAKHFSLDEMRTLCDDLGIDNEDVPGDNKTGKARELIVYCIRRDRLSDLVNYVKTERPDIKL
jgi:serine/threonine protein kinase